MNRPILYGTFTIIVASNGVGTRLIGSGGIRAGTFVTSIIAPAGATYGYCCQSSSLANMFIKTGITDSTSFSDLYAITTNGRLVIAGTPGTYTVEI